MNDRIGIVGWTFRVSKEQFILIKEKDNINEIIEQLRMDTKGLGINYVDGFVISGI